MRDKLRMDGDHTYFVKEYLNYIKTQLEIVIKVHKIILEKCCCLMCYERFPQECHRSIVAEEIKKIDGNGLIVKHI